MSVSYGFYNSIYSSGSQTPYDRIYQSGQMSKLFDGIILDGIFLSNRDDDPADKQFMVTADANDMTVTVAPGRAWFVGTYTVSDDDEVLSISSADSTYDRYDAVVIEVNTVMSNPPEYDDPESPSERFNSIKIVTGTAASEPLKPTMTHSDGIDQYPLAYVMVRKQTTAIRPYDIEYVVGIDTPYFAWLCERLSVAELYSKWQPILGNVTKAFTMWFASMCRMIVPNEDEYENMLDEIDLIESDNYASGMYPKVDEQEAKFSGTGYTKSFTISVSAGTVITGIADIFVDGDLIHGGYEYDASTKTVTLDSAPPSGTNNVGIFYVVEADSYTLYF